MFDELARRTVTKCPSCAAEIQAAASACTHCGRSLRAERAQPPVAVASKPDRSIVRSNAISVLLIFIGLLAISIASTLIPRNTATNTLAASVGREGPTLKISNQDHQDWRNVRVAVNDRFKCQPRSISQGTSALVPLLDCTLGDGTRFAAQTMVPVRVLVTAALVDDAIEASGLFTFDR